MAGHSTNQKLVEWVEHWREILQPDDVYWCDGSAEEYERMCLELVESGTFRTLNEAKRPNSYLAMSDPGDVARRSGEVGCGRSHGARVTQPVKIVHRP